MATQSQYRWSWSKPIYWDTFRFTSPSSSCSAYNLPFLCKSHTSSFHKRHLFITTSSPRHSSSSSSLSFSTSNSSHSTPDPPLNKPDRKRTVICTPVNFGNNEEKKKEAPLSQIQNQTSKGLSFKAFFGKKSLWRRIFFASKKVRSIILLNVITMVYASNIPVVKEVEAIMDPAAFTVVRFAISAIPFIPFVFLERGDSQVRNAGIELGLWVSLGYLMQALGLLTSDAGRASFLSMFTVIVVPLLDGVFGAVVPARTWFGAFMSLVGVAMLESSGSPPSIGDLLNFLSAAFFGVHMLRTERISRSLKKEKFLPLLGYEVSVVAILSAVWYFLGGCFGGNQEFLASAWSWTMVRDMVVAFPWIPAIYTGIFSTGLCLWVEMAAMRNVSATETAIIYGLEPVWGAGFAWFLLGERWGVMGWFGAAFVLCGSLTVQIMGASHSSESTEEEKYNNGGNMVVIENQDRFSGAPVLVDSRKNVSDLIKK